MGDQVALVNSVTATALPPGIFWRKAICSTRGNGAGSGFLSAATRRILQNGSKPLGYPQSTGGSWLADLRQPAIPYLLPLAYILKQRGENRCAKALCLALAVMLLVAVGGCGIMDWIFPEDKDKDLG